MEQNNNIDAGIETEEHISLYGEWVFFDLRILDL